MRVLHFSDIHLGLGLRRVPLRDWPGKRLAGGVNLLLGRRRRFARAADKVGSLVGLARSEEVDLVICTGDFTALGTDAELAAARSLVQPFVEARQGFVCVPGNHDLYAPDVLRERRFERHFGDLLASDESHVPVDGPWPLMRQLGDDIAVVAVNSARPNPAPWRSSGWIPPVQLAALGAVLERPEIERRFALIVTHYAPRLADGRRDHAAHGLVNSEAFLQTCSGLRRGAILCGHMHRTYHLPIPGGSGPEILCAGSATVDGHEGFWLLDLDEAGLSARRGRWTGSGWALDRASAETPTTTETR